MDSTTAPEKLVINGQEYDPADAQQLIDLGNKTRELETKWNTPVDKVWPNLTQAQQKAARVDSLEKELEALKAQNEQFTRQQQIADTPQEKLSALKAARELGLVDRDSLKDLGMVTKSDLDSYFQTKQQEQFAVQNVLSEADRLEKEISGEDGRVPFHKKAVLAYASAYQKSTLAEAYEEMNEGLNRAWKQQQIEAAKRPGLTTLKGRGMKTSPEEKKVTNENFGDMLKETLWGSEE